MNLWQVDLKTDDYRFDIDFKKLSETCRDYVIDSITDLPKLKNPKTDYEYSVSCASIPPEIILIRFPNGCELIIEMNGNTLYFLRTYDDIHLALLD